ncbi:hypothetical protein SETIT_5G138400v2 [Setaria italica]|uniref:Uncharacterized protein n=2 Tax=Setaria italica TaxID=4555 RepID=A0A368R4G9_SETIT|nr:hypothetical protein SETIT_5G138400v2 [Setaria italica]
MAAATVARGLQALVKASPHAQVPVRMMGTIPNDPAVKRTGLLAEQIVKLVKESPECTMESLQPLLAELATTTQQPPYKIAEALARASKDNTDALFKRLETILKPEEQISKPLTLGEFNQQSLISRLTRVESGLEMLNQQSLASRLTRVETRLEVFNQQTLTSRLLRVESGLEVNSRVAILLVGILGGGTIMMLGYISTSKEFMKSSDAEFKRIKKEFLRIDSRLSNVEPKLCCSACGDAVVLKNPAVDDILEEAATAQTSATVKDDEGWWSWIWGTFRRWF